MTAHLDIFEHSFTKELQGVRRVMRQPYYFIATFSEVVRTFYKGMRIMSMQDQYTFSKRKMLLEMLTPSEKNVLLGIN
jgi:hypothetical protein